MCAESIHHSVSSRSQILYYQNWFFSVLRTLFSGDFYELRDDGWKISFKGLVGPQTRCPVWYSMFERLPTTGTCLGGLEMKQRFWKLQECTWPSLAGPMDAQECDKPSSAPSLPWIIRLSHSPLPTAEGSGMLWSIFCSKESASPITLDWTNRWATFDMGARLIGGPQMSNVRPCKT